MKRVMFVAAVSVLLASPCVFADSPIGVVHTSTTTTKTRVIARDPEADRLAEVESKLLAQIEGRPTPKAEPAPEPKASLKRAVVVEKETRVIKTGSTGPIVTIVDSDQMRNLRESNSELHDDIRRQRVEIQRLREQKEDLEKLIGLPGTTAAKKPTATTSTKANNASNINPTTTTKTEKEAFVDYIDREPTVYESLSVPNPQLTESGLIARTFRPSTPVRLGPSMNDSVLTYMDSGVELEIESRSGNWYRVRTPQRGLGWIPSSVVVFTPVEDYYNESAVRVRGYDPELGHDELPMGSSNRY